MTFKLIFLTTAITRGDLHSNSIGNFYKRTLSYFENYELFHVINIDFPKKLRDKFSIQETKNLLEKIIPEKVKIVFTEKYEEDPSFAKAYSCVIKTMLDNNLLDEDSYVWWLEDDWMYINDYNFIPLLNFLDTNTNTALSITDKAPLCSLRGGPIMNSLFFKTFFDLSKNTGKFDPEVKIGRNIRMNRSVSVYEKDFYIISIHILDKTKYPYDMMRSCPWYYKRKFNNITKFSKGKKIKFILALIENETSNILHYKMLDNPYDLQIKNKEDITYLQKIKITDFKLLLNNSVLNYITIVPHIFKDIGRIFNANNNLISPKQE